MRHGSNGARSFAIYSLAISLIYYHPHLLSTHLQSASFAIRPPLLSTHLQSALFTISLTCCLLTCKQPNLLSASLAVYLLAISLICYQPHLLSPYLLSIHFLFHLLSVSLALASLAIKTFDLQSQLLSMLICYPKLVTTEIRCYQI